MAKITKMVKVDNYSQLLDYPQVVLLLYFQLYQQFYTKKIKLKIKEEELIIAKLSSKHKEQIQTLLLKLNSDL